MTNPTSPWIALTTRKPTQTDLDQSGDVLEYCNIDTGLREFQGPFLQSAAGFTHWRTVPRPPLPARPTQRELDDLDMLAFWRGQGIDFAQHNLNDLVSDWGGWVSGWRDSLKWLRLSAAEREHRRGYVKAG